MDFIQLELLSKRIEKTSILFEIYQSFKNYFDKKPFSKININFIYEEIDLVNPHYIKVDINSDDSSTNLLSHFSLLIKAVSIFDINKSPFGQFAVTLSSQPKNLSISVNQENFLKIFDYADDFDGKEEWISLLPNYSDNIKYNFYYDSNEVWGEYPKIIFNQKSYNDWMDLRNSYGYAKGLCGKDSFINKVINWLTNLDKDEELIFYPEKVEITKEEVVVESYPLPSNEQNIIPEGYIVGSDLTNSVNKFIKQYELLFIRKYSLTANNLNQLFLNRGV